MAQRAHIIVLGNAKGGSGKSTTAMHIAVRLLSLGKSVAVLDLDGRQQTLTRYFENRQEHAEKRGIELPMPTFAVVTESDEKYLDDAKDATYEFFCDTLERMSATHHFVVIDCPGSDTFLARLGHSVADTLVTPMNDSFVDVDLLARVDPDTFEVRSPSWYSEMIWEQRKRRFLSDHHAIDWVVLRNRLSHTEARNKRHVNQVLTALAPRIGFRHIPGLGERVIFRELFLKGLTLSDLKVANNGVTMTMTHVAAHQEIKDMVGALRLPLQNGFQAAPLMRGTSEPLWAAADGA